jgi:hypothetical protein
MNKIVVTLIPSAIKLPVSIIALAGYVKDTLLLLEGFTLLVHTYFWSTPSLSTTIDFISFFSL